MNEDRIPCWVPSIDFLKATCSECGARFSVCSKADGPVVNCREARKLFCRFVVSMTECPECGARCGVYDE
jgi:uncharacterized protein (DUF983 family)